MKRADGQASQSSEGRADDEKNGAQGETLEELAMGQSFKETYKQLVDERLRQLLPGEDVYPEVIHEAMAYSLFAGGKRFRPLLCLCACEAVGGNWEAALDTACALEMVNTYSLIHDDLPGMDNDDYRRGKLTNHKVYGEGIAILAGDALLTQAFEVLADCGLRLNQPQKTAWAVKELAHASGSLGMVGGQVADIISEGQQPTKELLNYIHHHKTAALIMAAVQLGGIFGDAQPTELAHLKTYGRHLGLAYQITDDILDITGDEAKIGKPVGSDIKNNKATFPALYGLAQSQEMAQEAVEAAIRALGDLPGNTDKLMDMAKSLIGRQA